MSRLLWLVALGAHALEVEKEAVQVTDGAVLKDVQAERTRASRKAVVEPRVKVAGEQATYRSDYAHHDFGTVAIREHQLENATEIGVVRNGTPPHQLGKLSLAQVSSEQETRHEEEQHQDARATAQFVGRVTGALCSCLLGMAICTYGYKMCCGEKSCFYTWPSCKKKRLAAGLDDVPSIVLHATVHRARDLGAGHSIFIAILPRRGKSGRTKPKLTKGASAMTAATQDMKWEQHLQVPVEQGCDVLQICAFKKARIGKGQLIGWDNVRVADLLNRDMEPMTRKWLYFSNDEGSPVGSCNITIQAPEVDEKGKPKKKKGAASQGAPVEDTSMPSVQGLDESETLEAYAKALSGPLNQANKLGEYNLRYFRVEQKRDVWIWAWYKEKNPQPGAKPLGRIPLLSISTIYEVPHSISEFIVRYRDATDRAVDMMLERTDRPRELWVKSMHKMVTMVKEERKRNKSDRKSEDKQAKSDAPRLKVPHDPKHKRRAPTQPKPDDGSSDTDDEGASVSSFSGSITSQASDNSRRDPKSQHLSVPKPAY